jgi:hypothetical protein
VQRQIRVRQYTRAAPLKKARCGALAVRGQQMNHVGFRAARVAAAGGTLFAMSSAYALMRAA